MKRFVAGSGQGAAVSAAVKRRFPIPNPQSLIPRRSGFTLVELLVVIVIISMLVGLLTPALISARGRARTAQCTNNQHELSLAVQQYDVAKQHLPGYINLLHGTTVGWVPVLLPYIGRMDLWEGSSGNNGWRSGAVLGSRINLLICPDDTGTTATYPLTYVVNAGVYNVPPTSTVPPLPVDPGIVLWPNSKLTPTPSPGGLGVFRDYTTYANNPVAPSDSPPYAIISLSNIRSASQTVMLSERALADRDWTTDVQGHNFVFTWPNWQPLAAPVAAPASTDQPSLSGTLIGVAGISGTVSYPAPLPPIHPGIVIVTFCDGHTESLTDDTPCSNYQAVP